VRARPVDAITFDFWDTIVCSERGDIDAIRLDDWAAVLDLGGVPCDDGLLRERLARFTSGYQVLRRREAARPVESIAVEVLAEMACFPEELWPALTDAFSRAPEGLEVEYAEELGDVLRALRKAGIRVGIVSNVEFTPSWIMRGYLEAGGMLELFDDTAFSDEAGAYKPGAEIFRIALRGLGTPAPERAIHVGNSRRLDVAGALGAGMLAVRHAEFDDDRTPEHPEAPHVVSRLRELLPLVGLG
jgi:FMN phosphatase YigB (HAD superfamily)